MKGSINPLTFMKSEPEAPVGLNPPYGGFLKHLLVEKARAEALKTESRDWPSWDLTARQTCDLELLLNGGFSPLAGFMRRTDYEQVCREMRLADGTLWPIPVVLDVSEAFAGQIGLGTKIALRDPEGVILAVLTVEDIWRPDHLLEAESVLGSTSRKHPGVKFLLDQTGPVYVGGSVEGLELPQHHDFQPLRHTPAQLRSLFHKLGWSRVVAFQTRNPIHRAHFEMTQRAAREHQANLLIHPVVGMTRPGDVDHFCRVRCYQAILPCYPDHLAALSLLPLSMRMGGPREAVWHAIIRRNYGATHLIVGRDHAGPGPDSHGVPFYGPYDAQAMAEHYSHEIGVKTILAQELAYLTDEDRYVELNEVPYGARVSSISGTQVREEYLAKGKKLPEWFTRPEVAEVLQRAYAQAGDASPGA